MCLKVQVESGLFDTVEDAIATTVTAAYKHPSNDPDLSWAKPHLDQAERDFASGKTLTHTQVWDHMVKR